MRMVFGSTVPATLDAFMRGQLSYIASQGNQVRVVSSPGPELDRIAAREPVCVHELPMEREISPAADIRALIRWVSLIRALHPDVVVVGTPKAGLLGGVSAAVMRVPRRVYLMRGARFEGVAGVKGALLRATERVSCGMAHTVIAVSESLADVALDAGVVRPGKLRTVASGSSNGVDTERFHPPSDGERSDARRRLGLASDRVAIAYVGRLHPDKGLNVLAEGLQVLGRRHPDKAVLLVAGTYEGASGISLEAPGVDVQLLGHVDDVPTLLHACDLLVLPSQREGFPNVVLEAAASGLPVVTTDATGAVDSVVDGVTGLIVPKQDGQALGCALSQLVVDMARRESMGRAARQRAEREFANEVVWRGMLAAYMDEADAGPLSVQG